MRRISTQLYQFLKSNQDIQLHAFTDQTFIPTQKYGLVCFKDFKGKVELLSSEELKKYN